MKTKTSQMYFLAGVVAILFLSLSVAGHAAEYVSVKKDAVNIRSNPSTNSKVIWQVFKSFPLKVIKREGKWANVVDFEGDKGWIYETLISSKKSVIVNVETANMRSGPGTSDTVVATVKKGVVFEPLEAKGDWLKVRYKTRSLAGCIIPCCGPPIHFKQYASNVFPTVVIFAALTMEAGKFLSFQK